MSAPYKRDCGETLEDFLTRCRTVNNRLLHTGKPIKRAVEIEPVFIPRWFHQSATESFAEYPAVAHNTTALTDDKAYLPVGNDNNVHTAELIQNIQITNAASTATLATTAGSIAEVEHMRLTCSALGAARTCDISIADGTNTTTIWSSLGANVASGADFAIWPVDVSTYYAGAVALIGTQVTITPACYIEIDSSDIAGAETMDLYVHWKAKRVAGFE